MLQRLAAKSRKPGTRTVTNVSKWIYNSFIKADNTTDAAENAEVYTEETKVGEKSSTASPSGVASASIFSRSPTPVACPSAHTPPSRIMSPRPTSRPATRYAAPPRTRPASESPPASPDGLRPISGSEARDVVAAMGSPFLGDAAESSRAVGEKTRRSIHEFELSMPFVESTLDKLLPMALKEFRAEMDGFIAGIQALQVRPYVEMLDEGHSVMACRMEQSSERRAEKMRNRRFTASESKLSGGKEFMMYRPGVQATLAHHEFYMSGACWLGVFPNTDTADEFTLSRPAYLRAPATCAIRGGSLDSLSIIASLHFEDGEVSKPKILGRKPHVDELKLSVIWHAMQAFLLQAKLLELYEATYSWDEGDNCVLTSFHMRNALTDDKRLLYLLDFIDQNVAWLDLASSCEQRGEVLPTHIAQIKREYGRLRGFITERIAKIAMRAEEARPLAVEVEAERPVAGPGRP